MTNQKRPSAYCFESRRLCFNGNRKNGSVATVLRQSWGRGGAKVTFEGTVFVFLKLPPAACTIPGYEINLRQCRTVPQQLQPYGNTHKNHSRHVLNTFETVTTRWKPGFRYAYF